MTRVSTVKTCTNSTLAISAAIAAAMITTMMLVESYYDRQLDTSRKPAMVEKGSQQCRPLINKPPPLCRDYHKDPNIKGRKRRRYINHGSTLRMLVMDPKPQGEMSSILFADTMVPNKE